VIAAEVTNCRSSFIVNAQGCIPVTQARHDLFKELNGLAETPTGSILGFMWPQENEETGLVK
jgi:hypothetical protein